MPVCATIAQSILSMGFNGVVIRQIYYLERQGTPRCPIQRTAIEVAIYQQSGRFALQVSRQMQRCGSLFDSALE